MSKYIDAELLVKLLNRARITLITDYTREGDEAFNACIDVVSDLVTNEMPESIVRCKDCKYYTHYKWIDIVTNEAIEGYRCDKDIISNTIDVNPDDFCSYGERRESE